MATFIADMVSATLIILYARLYNLNVKCNSNVVKNEKIVGSRRFLRKSIIELNTLKICLQIRYFDFSKIS